MSQPVPEVLASDTNTSTTRSLNFRPPPAIQSSPDYQPAESKWMAGSWYVTHSTLPMWKSNRNVKITYSPQPDSPDTFDNIVEYNPINSDKYKSVSGVERPDAKIGNAWNWRGKGWLMIASSHWEVLGWGEEDGGWMVTFFQKTLFTPAGIDICVRRRTGVSEKTLQRIRESIRLVKEDADFAKLGETMFEVKQDV